VKHPEDEFADAPEPGDIDDAAETDHPDAPRVENDQSAGDASEVDENSGDDSTGDGQFSDEATENESSGDGYTSDEHSNDEHSADEDSNDVDSANEDLTNEDSADEHSSDEYSPDEHSSDEYSPDEHSSDEYSPDEYSSDEHSTEGHSTEETATDTAEHAVFDEISDGDHESPTEPESSDDDAAADSRGDASGEDGFEAASDGETDGSGDTESTPDYTLGESSPVEPDTSPNEPVVAAPATGTAVETIGSSSPTFDDSTPLARELAEITRRRQALRAQELPLPPEPRIFTIANQKGGVGKTTTTVNLAAALARSGANVLVIDLDPQGNASTALGVEHRAETVSVYDVIINDQLMADVVQKSPEFDGLFCVPATIHLAGAEIELVSLVAREQRLRTALDKFLAEADRPFHYVFIDCPPSLGLLTINAFVAAREVLIPIQCEYYALEGLSQLLSNIQLIERHLNPRLAVSTILMTMYDSRTNLANQVVDEVREHFPKEVLTTLIPRSVRISEAPSYGQSVVSYDPSSSGSLSYLEAAAEMARRGAPS
jgi:chromosome partitioning protein